MATRRAANDPLAGIACNSDRFRYNERMNATLKITKIGNSAGIILPREVLARLRVSPEGREGLSAFLERRKPDWQK